MEVITSHTNTDFDSFAAMIAARKIYPDAIMAFSGSLNPNVRDFYSLHADVLVFADPDQIDLSRIKRLIIVDTRSAHRLGEFGSVAEREDVEVFVFDHHPVAEGDLRVEKDFSQMLGTTTTILLEMIKERRIEISPLEATIFALGIYEETGSLTYSTTTARDVEMLAFLMSQKANLEVVRTFLGAPLSREQHQLLEKLIFSSHKVRINDVDILISTAEMEEYIDGLSILTNKLGEIEESRVIFTAAGTEDRIYMVGRSRMEEVDASRVLAHFGGGGHPQAASAVVRDSSLAQVERKLISVLKKEVMKPQVAGNIMSRPVKTIDSETTILEAGNIMTKYGHAGLPIVQGDKLIGVISRKDVDKAIGHGLGHAPVKGFISKEVVTADPATSIMELRTMMIEHNIGRIPVVDKGELAGIITRTDLLKALHGSDYISGKEQLPQPVTILETSEVKKRIKNLLPDFIQEILKKTGQIASELNVKAYLVGGIVRDILLNQPNFDLDIVIEGDGITLAKRLGEIIGGRIRTHQKFGTAVLILKDGFHVDIATARTEFYEYPAALPSVERGSIRQDLYRRDFTINAMAISLNENTFGEVLDFFGGQRDLVEKKIRVLHNLSFIDDPTRIFRAIRFEQRFGFQMDGSTEILLRKALGMELVEELTSSRVRDEIILILSEPEPWKAVKRLTELGVTKILHPRLVIDEVRLEDLKKIDRSYVQLQEFFRERPRRWLCLLMGLLIDFSPQEVIAWTLKMKFRKRDIGKMEESIRNFTHTAKNLSSRNLKDSEIYLLCQGLSPEALVLLHALKPATSKPIEKYVKSLEDVQVKISGRDLKEMGYRPGPLFRKALTDLLLARIDGQVRNREEEEKFVRQWMEVEGLPGHERRRM